MNQVNECITKIEANEKTQQGLDNVYESFCELVKDGMGRKLKSKIMTVNFSMSNKRRRVRKP